VTLKTIWNWSFETSLWLLAAAWFWQVWLCFRHLPELANLIQVDLPNLPTPENLRPQMTVIVPACNEQGSIEATLQSLLASVEIRLQIIAVNDRSTDGTAKAMEKIAVQARNQNLNQSMQIIHIKKLASGWLGKPHALAVAAHSAEAEWILFTDGDVLFAPDALSRALRYAIAEQADHLVVMPDWVSESFGESAMHGAMHALTTWKSRLWQVADPDRPDFLGVGAFNLVRREVYEKLGGFRALRMEVLEDLRFGWMVKRAGFRQQVALGSGLVSVRWAHGAWGVVLNLEKNLFALHRYNTALTLLTCTGLAVQIVWPLAGLFVGGWAQGGALLTYAAIAAVYFVCRRVTRVSPVYALFFPVAIGLFLFAMVRSMTLALVRGGVMWRGTAYSLKDLRAHAGRFW
jgi:glycosyltransferase involved in cell wall biosynthesis